MIRNRSAARVLLAVALCALPWPGPAQAYVGPGAGLSAIGAFFAVVAGLIVALFGFVWYPVRRFLRFLRRRKTGSVRSDVE